MPKMFPLTTIVVDNNKYFLRFVAHVLGDHYADLLDVRAACSAYEAIACCAAIQPQVVLLDLGLPGMTNLALVAPLRQVAPSAIIIMLSSEDQPPYVAAARDAGAVVLLGKATLNTTLRKAVEAALYTGIV